MMVELLLFSSQSASGSATGNEEWVSIPNEVLPAEIMNRFAEANAEWHKAQNDANMTIPKFPA